jgi:hypothetical protein
MTNSETELRVRRSRQIATLLDGAWLIPGTSWRFGADSLLGLLPIAGDLLSALLGLSIVWQAYKLNAPRSLQFRMLGNLSLDFLLGSVPVIGDIADVAFRKNIRNADLLEAWVAKQVKSR